MPPRNTDLPEGTDHIINGAMETGGGTGSGGGAGSGFIGGTEGGGFGDGTGGTTSRGFGDTTVVSSGAGQGGGTAVSQLKDSAASLKDQAATKVRSLADDGKTRATDALDEFSRVVDEAAGSIDERLGAEYGDYARRAAGAVSNFATTIRDKDVDELYADARGIVRKSPVAAIGVAAAVGFALVRLIKSGLPDETGPGDQPRAPYVDSNPDIGA